MVKIRHMANTFRKVYKKTGNSGSSSDYQLVGNIGVNGVELDIMKGATSSSAGEIGLVPKPSAGSSERYLSANGTFKEIDGYSQLKTDVGDLSWLNTTTKKDLVAAINDVEGRGMMFQAWNGTNVDATSWTNIMAFSLSPGNYLIMWTCQVSSIQSSNAIYGTRIRWTQKNVGSQQQIHLNNHISNQMQSTCQYTWVELAEEQTIYIDFYHNIANQSPFVHFKQAFVFPLTGKMLESTI